jgi:hypothetical protein
MPVEDPVSNNILCNALEVCNKGSIRKKTQTPFNYRKCSVDSVGSRHIVDAMSV